MQIVNCFPGALRATINTQSHSPNCTIIKARQCEDFQTRRPRENSGVVSNENPSEFNGLDKRSVGKEKNGDRGVGVSNGSF